MADEFQVKLDQARARLPLRLIMDQRSKAPDGKKCPYCGKKGGGFFKAPGSGTELFKCHHTSCPSGTADKGKAWDQVGFLMHELRLTWKDAAIVLMKEANVWQESEKYAPSIMPGKAARKRALPVMREPEPEGGKIEDPPSLGASARQAENDKTNFGGVAGTHKSDAPSDCAAPEAAQPSTALPAIPIKNENGDRGDSVPTNTNDLASGESGVLSPREGVHSRTGEEPSAVDSGAGGVAASGSGFPPDGSSHSADLIKNGGAETRRQDAGAPSGEADRPKVTMETLFGGGGAAPEPPKGGTPNGEAASEAKVVDMSGRPVPADGAPGTARPALEPPANDGKRLLRDFYERLALTGTDEKAIFERRGLESRTQVALGFRSNPRLNKQVLTELGAALPWEEKAASGLFLERDPKRKKERRPNAQFCGAGIVRKLRAGEKPGRGQWADDDGNLWAWCEPVLIPYVDAEGRLIGLRPHKGGGRAETVVGRPRVYVPRPVRAPGRHSPMSNVQGPKSNGIEDRQVEDEDEDEDEDDKEGKEKFYTVVITEGEFKAAALWQVIGLGRNDGGEPVGVAALPGISFGKHYEIREELDAWLRRVRCRCVKVIYDNEEKGDPRYREAFKPDKRKRFDSQIWARYLATDLAQKLHIRGEVGVLPREWRNEKGKADWDGALAEFAGNFP